ncbi:MAG TPA: peptidylprolyl isomerase [Gemmatimonadaceae bacterium]|nr:peptidylprolyl isomerase [Gemmatimonadaceae bacterium]
MRSRTLISLAAACTVLTACEGLKEALTAHVDVVARAGNQELSVTRLGDLLGNAKIPVPVTRDNAAIIADIWTGYQQIAYAAAHGDSLNDKAAIDKALAPLMNAQKLSIYMDSVQKTFKVDSGSEAAYNQAAGGLVAARHILIGYKNPAVPPTQAEKDSLRKKAEQVRAQVTPQNFADMVAKYSTDPTAAQNKGSLGVFGKGTMITAFYDAARALKPGEISQPIETQYGFHIIQRLPYADAQKDFAAQYAQTSARDADSTFMAGVEQSANVQVKDNAPGAMKDAAKDQPKHRTDNTVLATFNGGELTVADYLNWLETFPPQQQIAQRIPTAPDSVLKPFAKQLAVQQVLLKRANDAKVQVPGEQVAQLYQSLSQLVQNVWQNLGVDPKMLADSAKTPAEKERLAASRVDSYLDRMMAGEAQPMTIPTPLKKLLDSKYESSINSAGIDRAFDRAQKVRAAADSAKSANQPKSQIPIPGMPGNAPPSGAQPQPANPAPAPAPASKKP